MSRTPVIPGFALNPHPKDHVGRRVFVAGATGAIGRRLVPRLLAAGHTVVGTTRNAERMAALRQLGATAVLMDGLDRDSVMHAVIDSTPNVVIQQQTALSRKLSLRNFDKAFAATNELRTRGTDFLIEAAVASGASRFLAQSYTGWTNKRAGGPIATEDDSLDLWPPNAMRETLDVLIRQEHRVTEQASLEGLALRYGFLYGPGTSLATGGGMLEAIRQRRFPLVGEGQGVWSFVHIDDAAEATVLAVAHGPSGVYNVVDDHPAPVSEWLPYVARTIGAKPPRRVPLPLGRLAAGEVAVSLLTQVRGSANAKAKQAFNWQPAYPTWRDGFRHALGDDPSTGLRNA